MSVSIDEILKELGAEYFPWKHQTDRGERWILFSTSEIEIHRKDDAFVLRELTEKRLVIDHPWPEARQEWERLIRNGEKAMMGFVHPKKLRKAKVILAILSHEACPMCERNHDAIDSLKWLIDVIETLENEMYNMIYLSDNSGNHDKVKLHNIHLRKQLDELRTENKTLKSQINYVLGVDPPATSFKIPE